MNRQEGGSSLQHNGTLTYVTEKKRGKEKERQRESLLNVLRCMNIYSEKERRYYCYVYQDKIYDITDFFFCFKFKFLLFTVIYLNFNL